MSNEWVFTNYRLEATHWWNPQATHYQHSHPNSISLPIHEGFTLISPCRIASLVETGLVDYWKQVHYPQDSCVGEGDSTDNQRATVDEVLGVFIMLVVGLVLSLFVLMFEQFTQTDYFHHRWIKCQRWFYNAKAACRQLIKPPWWISKQWNVGNKFESTAKIHGRLIQFSCEFVWINGTGSMTTWRINLWYTSTSEIRQRIGFLPVILLLSTMKL